MTDPNDPQIPESPDPEAPQEQQEPQAPPPLDINSAYEVIAQAEGWDPRLTRYEIQEFKRRKDQFEQEKREFEQQRSRQLEPQAETSDDPYMQRLSKIERYISDMDRRDREEREYQALVKSIDSELTAAYTSQARQNGMTKEQMEAKAQEFYATLQEIYPEPQMIRAMGVEKAASAAFRILKANSAGQNGYAPPRSNPYRDPRAAFVIPTTASAPNGGAPPVATGMPFAPQRPDETTEQYRQRLLSDRERVGPIRIPEGVRVSSSS